MAAAYGLDRRQSIGMRSCYRAGFSGVIPDGFEVELARLRNYNRKSATADLRAVIRHPDTHAGVSGFRVRHYASRL
jgi:hypothetical protein